MSYKLVYLSFNFLSFGFNSYLKIKCLKLKQYNTEIILGACAGKTEAIKQSN